jgi:predicted DNA-binding protein (MmcQ/YjbR family)
MTLDRFRQCCTSLPHVSEDIKWEQNLVFSIGSKMFAIYALEPGEVWASFKCSPDDFADLIERPHCRPAPYLARAQWVALETPNAIPVAELEKLLAKAHQLVFAKLPNKLQRELQSKFRS